MYMVIDISIIALIAAFFALVALAVIMKSLRMPEGHYQTNRRRNELRQLLLQSRMPPPPDRGSETSAEDGSQVKSTG